MIIKSLRNSKISVISAIVISITLLGAISVFTLSSFSQNGTSTTQLTSAIQDISFEGADEIAYGMGVFKVGSGWLPGQTAVTKEMSLKNTGNVDLQYNLTTQSTEQAYYKIMGKLHMKLYINGNLVHEGSFTGINTSAYSLPVGQAHTIKIILSWPSSENDNLHSDEPISDTIRINTKLANGDKGFLINKPISISGRADYWVENVNVYSVTRNSAEATMNDLSKYKSTVIQYSTNANFTNAVSVVVPDTQWSGIGNKSYTLTNLTPNTTYYVRTRGNDPVTPGVPNLPIEKWWSKTFTFKTLS